MKITIEVDPSDLSELQQATTYLSMLECALQTEQRNPSPSSPPVTVRPQSSSPPAPSSAVSGSPVFSPSSSPPPPAPPPSPAPSDGSDASSVSPSQSPAPPPPIVAPRVAPPPPTTAATEGYGPADTGEELDALGAPWDADLHTPKRTQTKADGRWRFKRNLDPVKKQEWLDRYPKGDAPAPAAEPPQQTAMEMLQGNVADIFKAKSDVTFPQVVDALQGITGQHSQENIAAALKSAGIDPVGLESRPESWGDTLQVLRDLA